MSRVEETRADAAGAGERRVRPGVPGARIATLVVGGVIAALALAATSIGGAIALGVAPLNHQGHSLPSGITAIEVRAESLSVQVIGGPRGAGDPTPVAYLNGVSSSTLGALPGIDIELRGTTAVITPEEPAQPPGLVPYGLLIDLGALVLDRIDVETAGYVSIDGVDAAEIRATSQTGHVYVNLPKPSGLRQLEITSASGPQVVLPETGGPYQVLLPEWFDDAFVEQWWQDHYGLDYRTEVLEQDGRTDDHEAGGDWIDGRWAPGPERYDPSPLDGPGVFVPTDPDAAVTVDLRHTGGDMLQVLSLEALDRGAR